MGYTGDQKRQYDNEWRKKRRQDWIDSQGGKCVVCGSTDRLEVDHIDPTQKLLEPRAIWSRAQNVRDEELAKCQVLCYDHHVEKTRQDAWNRMGKAVHGSHTMYTKYKCRCRECQNAHAELARQTRAAGKKW